MRRLCPFFDLPRVRSLLLVLLITLAVPGRALSQDPAPPAGGAAPADSATADSAGVAAADSAGVAAADSAVVAEPDRSPAAEASRLLAELDTARDEIDELLRSANRNDAGDFELKRITAFRTIDRVDDLTAQLAKNLLQIDSTEARRDSLFGAATDHLLYQARLYELAYDNNLDEGNRLQKGRVDVEAAALPDLEAEIAAVQDRADLVVSLMKGTAQRMDRLGLDTSTLWEDYDKTISERAERLAGRLQLAAMERDRLREQSSALSKSGETETPDLGARIRASEIRVESTVKSLKNTAHVMQERDLRAAPYLQLALRTTGAVTDDLLNLEVLKGLALDLYKDFVGWMRENGPTILLRLSILALIVVATRLVFWTLWILGRLRVRSRLLRDLGGRMIKPSATFIGLLLGLGVLGVDPTTLLAGLGVAGVIVGLALQDSLANLAAGVFILIYKPYDVDDYVQAGGVLGKVRQMGLANTLVVTFDNRRLFVPNRKIWSEVIENRSSERVRRIDTTIRVRYDENVDVVFQHCRDILEASDLVLSSPAPTVFLEKLTDSWMEVAVWGWTKAETWWDLTMELPRMLHVGLSERGVRVPYPRREVETPEK